MEIKNGERTYEVHNLASENQTYRTFVCTHKESGRECLLQIPQSIEKNGQIDRMAYVLRTLDERAGELEKKYREMNPGKELNYNLGFPELLDSFICAEQGGRRINILAFRCVEKVSSILPLTMITQKHKQRVDIRTSAWIMGKTLKLLAFTQSEGIAVNLVNGNNILVVPDNHYVLFFNFTAAEVFAEGSVVPIETRSEEIAQAARGLIRVLGGDWVGKFIPNDNDEPFELYVGRMLERARRKETEDDDGGKYQKEAFGLYTNFLFHLASGRESDALTAHRDFYAIVDRLWKREFYPFTTKPLQQ